MKRIVLRGTFSTVIVTLMLIGIPTGGDAAVYGRNVNQRLSGSTTYTHRGSGQNPLGSLEVVNPGFNKADEENYYAKISAPPVSKDDTQDSDKQIQQNNSIMMDFLRKIANYFAF